MVKVRLLVTGFASHETWARGVQRSSSHDVELDVQQGDRWKFRMLVAATECRVHEDDDIIVVDSMLDVTPLVAMLRGQPQTKVLVYMHENQLTTPWNKKDRDVQNQTHWTFGMVHLRSLFAADGVVFNSDTHLQSFQDSLVRLVNEQCPRDVVDWYLNQTRELMTKKCCVLKYGLELSNLLVVTGDQTNQNEDDGPPIVLWNARLEQDKDPDTFIQILHQAKQKTSFRLVVLGSDPSKGQIWYERFRNEFRDELLYLGWCTDRSEYAKWLRKSHIVVSTAQHETFGISVVESVYCGAVPLLPNRLSYPELFSPDTFPKCFFRSQNEAVAKLVDLLEMFVRHPKEWCTLADTARDAISKYRWEVMGPVYDEFFAQVAAGISISDVTNSPAIFNADVAKGSVLNTTQREQPSSAQQRRIHANFTVISEAGDPLVQLYRPKSVRDHKEYHEQVTRYRKMYGMDPVLHGGRRATVRMLEALSLKSTSVRPISFLTTRELAEKVFIGSEQKGKSLVPEGTPLYVAEKDLLDKIRGQKLNAGDAILAVVDFPVSCALSEVLASPPILILEDVRNAENVGSILRTAFCLGITSVVATPTSWAALKDSRAARCSMGTMYYHRYYRSSSILSETLTKIREAGLCVYGIEIGSDAKPVHPHGRDRNWAMVLGNEDTGLGSGTRRACDSLVFVPQAHGDSLNVGHAAAITMFQLGNKGGTPLHDGKASCA